MKKIISLALAAVLVICCFGLVSCGGGDAEGLYKISSYKMGDVVYEVGGEAPWGDTFNADDMTIELKSGGEAVITNMGNATDGTWSLDGSEVTITIQGQETILKLSGNELSIETANYKAVYKK